MKQINVNIKLKTELELENINMLKGILLISIFKKLVT